MSLQVTNQTGGRRTPQVYQGFGGVAGGGTGTTASNGGGPTSAPGAGAGTGSVGRPPKGSNKPSMIPVVIGGPGSHDATASPMGGGSLPGVGPTEVMFAQSGLSGVKQFQIDHQYGSAGKETQAQSQVSPPGGNAAGRKATNGTQQQTAPATVAVEKNGTSQKKSSNGGDATVAVVKTDLPSQQSTVVTPAEGAKVRDSPRSSGRGQQQPKPVLSDETPVSKIPEIIDVENSLLAEKSLKGFEADDMESLQLDPWDFEDSPMPSRSAASKSKIPKATPQAQARVNQNKTAGKTEPEPAVEQKSPAKKQAEEEKVEKSVSPRGGNAGATAPATPTTGDESLIGRPLRSISGRRSTRPIADIKFTHHRRVADQHNDSISSLNVTVGSDIGNDSGLMRTPGSASRKRKDMTPESTSDGAPIESPKRARLDFSGFLGMVATPVTMLKNRLSRVKLQSPSSSSLAVDEENASQVVTAEATTTTTTAVPTVPEDAKTAPEAAATMEVDEANKDQPSEAAQTAIPEKDATDEQQQSSSADTEDDVEVKIVTDQQQKAWCSIM